MSQTLEWGMSPFVETDETIYVKGSSACPLTFSCCNFIRSLHGKCNLQTGSFLVTHLSSKEQAHEQSHLVC